MDIKLLEPTDIPQAVTLFLEQYADLRHQLPFLPPSASMADRFTEMLQSASQKYPAFAAIQQGTLAGYMIGIPVKNLKGRCLSVYIPEWAHASIPQSVSAIYERLYTEAARAWVASGWYQQAVTLFSCQPEVETFFYTHGFGLHLEDGVCSLHALPAAPQDANIRRVEVGEAAALASLEEEYASYIRDAPIFLVVHAQSAEQHAQWLTQPANRAWFALQHGEPCGYLMVEAGAKGQADIHKNEHTCTISGAYLRPTERGRGLMRALLEIALPEYASQGYEICVLDFETQNNLARSYWRKHFHCATRSLFRRVDERIGDLWVNQNG